MRDSICGLLRAMSLTVLSAVLVAGCDVDVMGDKKDIEMERERHAREVREALQYERERDARRAAEREAKIRIAEEKRKADIEKARLEEERREKEREEKKREREAQRLAAQKVKEFEDNIRVFQTGRIFWWEDAPFEERRLRAVSDCTYLCLINSIEEGKIYFELKTSKGKVIGARRLHSDGTGEDMPREDCINLIKKNQVIVSRLAGKKFDSNLFVWNGKSAACRKFSIPDEYGVFIPTQEELGPLYECVGDARRQNPKIRYQIFFHSSASSSGELLCEVGFGEGVSKFDIQTAVFSMLFEQRSAERDARARKAPKAKTREIDPSLKSFRGPTRPYYGGRRAVERPGQRTMSHGNASMRDDTQALVSDSDVEAVLLRSTISYQIKAP